MGNASGDVRAAIEASRKELLDLGLRNPLLNYRATRARGVQIADELPKEVFRILVAEGKTMTFKATPETEGDAQSDESPEDSDGLAEYLDQPEEDDSGGPAARHVDLQLQTPLASPKLQSRLLKTERAARTFIEEQGINTLFLALGMLRWFEDENSQIERSAPLVLVPLHIERSSVQERFHVEYTGDELEENLSLASKLKLEFDISLPEMPPGDDFDISGYFNEVEKSVSREGRWRVDRRAISLDFFSFGKFLMYRDLEEERWPENAKLSLHPLIGTLLGENGEENSFSAPVVADDENLDRHIAPSDTRHVVDADSSQAVALLDAKSGRSLVIQGPPGTGKSQTITNLIAEALSQQKTVLFVSEKMAALEVVKRRLDSVGLGEACLELHSRKTKKAQVLEELGRTMALGSPRLEGSEGDLGVLEDLRDRLNDYCEAVNEEIEVSGITPYEAVGELIRQGGAGASSPRLDFEAMSGWNVVDLNRRQLLVERFQTKLSTMKPPRENAFHGTTLTMVLPMDERRIKEGITSALDLTRRLRDAGRNLAGALQLPSPTTREACEALIASAGWIESAPDVSGMNVKAEEWTVSREPIEALVSAGLAHSRIVGEHWDTLIPEAWEQNVLETRQVFAASDNRLKRLFSRQYRSERDRLRGLCRESLPEGHEEQLALVDSILEAQRSATTIKENRTLGERTLGRRWNGSNSDWKAVSEVAPWIAGLRENVERGIVPGELLDCLASGAGRNASELREALEEAMKEHIRVLASAVEKLSFEGGWVEKPLEAWDFERQEAVLSGWIDRFGDLREIADFNKIAAELRENGLSSAVETGERWDGAGAGLVDAYRYTWFEGLAEKALRKRPALSGFERGGHEQIVEKFRKLDALNLRRNRARIALSHWKGVPSHEGGGQLAVLRRELNKKRRHLPIRQLMKRAGNAVQAIKPVFMMSPLSIANFIEPGSVDFDLVVFDEASQVRPVEALGAVARGRQTVVVGDDKQLPPTRFFDSMLEGEPEDDTSMTEDLESVLGLFLAQGMPQRMLRWHYRSRHESLITVSNHEFYDDRLTIFPSPDRTGEDLGLVYHHLGETVYDRGKSRANVGEARAVAEAVMRHAREKPGLTLGVVAFSSAQAQAVEDQLEILRRSDPSREEFFTLYPFEPFFVKSLENVQGDERDVMFLSLGYGRDADGRLAMNFGPLNQDGGERRLNVLITRARRRCEVFTNLLPDDIDLSRTGARGVRSLKTFLKFARDGHLDVPTASGRAPDSPFEEAVLHALASLGYEVDTQVGSAGFFVDLAVKDPAKPGRYLLGVECDGATYHSARSARDRDRLRQEILEGLGWRIHRIWSTDWFKNPDTEIRRLVEAIEKARLHTEEKPSDEPGDTAIPIKTEDLFEGPVERVEAEEPSDSEISKYEVATIDTKKYVFDSRELHRLALEDMAEWVAEVVRMESPVHFDDIVRRIAEAGGVSRAGRRIRDAVESGCRRAIRRGWVKRSGDFFWRPEMEEAPLRDRSGLSDSSKKPERVAPEEMEKVIEKVVYESFGMPKRDIPSPVLKLLLGFQRVTKGASNTVIEAVEKMVKDGKLTEDGDHVSVSNRL